MKLYYYSEGEQQLGPFTIAELKTKRLIKSTLVWTDGMSDWISAIEIDELKDILISEPPPLPKKSSRPPIEKSIQIKQSVIPITNIKFDLTYKKETDATFIGMLLLTAPFIIKFLGITFDKETIVFLSIASLIIRIGVTVWVSKIASRQNRNATNWGWFAFLLPSLALIVIGQLKKLRLKIEDTQLDSVVAPQFSKKESKTTTQEIIIEKTEEEIENDRYKKEILTINQLLKEEKNRLFGGGMTDELRSRIENLCQTKDEAVYFLHIYQTTFRTDLINDLKKLSSSYDTIKRNLSTFIKLDIVTETYPHDLKK